MNTGSDFFDFIMEGGDELLNTKICFHCGEMIYLDQVINWKDKSKRIARCSSCGGEFKINE